MTISPAHTLALLNGDGRRLFLTRIARLFAYGFLSVVLVLYLDAAGLTGVQIGALLTFTLVGDTAISLWLTTNADRVGRRRMLLAGAGLMIFAGVLFALTRNYWLLLLAATIGVISPSGNEVGPFLAVEQASLSQLIPGERRTQVFAWYNLVGSFATALGALCGGALAQALQGAGLSEVDGYRVIVLGYAAMGTVLLLVFLGLTDAVEISGAAGLAQAALFQKDFGLHRSRDVVFKLSALFALDALAGGFVIQSVVAYWFHLRFGVEPAALGGIFFGANILAGISALSAVRLAERFGLINTMVFTHIPSNLLLMLVPLMPSLPLAAGLLLLRYSISQMDVPTRQSYTLAVVLPDERSAAAGITGIARTVGAAIAPALTGPLLASVGALSSVFFIAGGLKLMYDLSLWRSFRALKPPEEAASPQ